MKDRMKQTLGGRGLALAVCVAGMLLSSHVLAQNLAELEDRVEQFQEDARSIYRFDEDARQLIWEAYCGLLDPNADEGEVEYDRDFAFEVGLSYQRQQEDLWEELMDQVGSLIEDLEALEENPDTEDRAGELLEIVVKEAGTLQDLEEGVVLRGANHPFVQFAITYGMEQHDRMCDSEGEEPKVRDETWPTLSGRPDLVYVDDDGLWILEFKPDNDRARQDGQRQLLGYVEGVEEYYQGFFPEGRDAGYTDTPDSDHGGEEIVKKLMETEEAWDSDGEEIIAKFDVVTYDRCEQEF